jgi:predicted transposase/invertase (TIGR01784 family)
LVGVIAIHILNGVVSQESEEYHSIFELRERKNPKVVLTPQLQIHLLELPKFHLAAEAIQDNLERWSYFLKHAEALEPRQLPVNLQTDDISQAVEVLQIMNQDDRERMLYEARQKAWRDAETNRVEAFDRGIDRGRLVQMYEQLEWFLNLKFSSSGTALMPVVRRVESLDSLLQIRDWIQAANSIEELTRKLVVE